ncbi:MAG: alpha/beta hydrolase [Chloroflexi bacterium]|nr:alpha/beta hydrolase [Chloroflexota bacterium]
MSEAGYADANGLRTYWETHGHGEPVLLLHGGFEHAGALPHLTAALAARYRVIEPERRAHGRTPDPGGDLHYEAMTEDTLAFVNALGLARPRVVGFSDGAIVALLLVLRRPDRCGRLVLVGANYDGSGLRLGFLRLVTETPLEHVFPELAAAHRPLSPDCPQHYRHVFERVRRLLGGGAAHPARRAGARRLADARAGGRQRRGDGGAHGRALPRAARRAAVHRAGGLARRADGAARAVRSGDRGVPGGGG